MEAGDDLYIRALNQDVDKVLSVQSDSNATSAAELHILLSRLMEAKQEMVRLHESRNSSAVEFSNVAKLVEQQNRIRKDFESYQHDIEREMSAMKNRIQGYPISFLKYV